MNVRDEGRNVSMSNQRAPAAGGPVVGSIPRAAAAAPAIRSRCPSKALDRPAVPINRPAGPAQPRAAIGVEPHTPPRHRRRVYDDRPCPLLRRLRLKSCPRARQPPRAASNAPVRAPGWLVGGRRGSLHVPGVGHRVLTTRIPCSSDARCGASIFLEARRRPAADLRRALRGRLALINPQRRRRATRTESTGVSEWEPRRDVRSRRDDGLHQAAGRQRGQVRSKEGLTPRRRQATWNSAEKGESGDPAHSIRSARAQARAADLLSISRSVNRSINRSSRPRHCTT